MPRVPRLSSALLTATAAGVGAVAYGSVVETRSFRLRRVTVPVLPAGQRPMRILHLSDLHLQPGQRRKQNWVRSLAGLEPDLVVDTGDNLASPQAVPYVLDTYGPLLQRPGVFVWGSNDYYAPRPKNPARYLMPRQKHVLGRSLPWRDLRDGLQAAGWRDLTHRRETLTIDGRRLELRGVDDPHLNRDRYPTVAGPADPLSDFAIGVVHAPYVRVLDAMTADGLPLILAGHTHGGQLRVPGYGAIVTNCDLPRQQARGLSAWGKSALHVSAGLGCSPFAPVRFACPPEATLLTLVERLG
jgi:predicted MPP superfamily phosphohydrolase